MRRIKYVIYTYDRNKDKERNLYLENESYPREKCESYLVSKLERDDKELFEEIVLENRFLVSSETREIIERIPSRCSRSVYVMYSMKEIMIIIRKKTFF